MFSVQKQTSEHADKKNSFNAKASYPSRTIVHPKLETTEPGDSDEQEADAVANDVVNGRICRQISHGNSGGGMTVSSQMEGRLNSLQGRGQIMPDGLRNMMERGFNRDFSQVRLHTDSEAVSLSSSINAKAFTHGNDIYFNQGQYSPNTSEGKKLMAHELTHVVQGGGRIGRETNTCEDTEYESMVCSQDTYSYLSSLSINKQQAKERRRNRRHREIGNATEENLHTYHDSITIAFILSNKVDHNNAFSTIDLGNIKNNLYAFHPSSIGECLEILNKCRMYGPLQNLIIVGHGNWNGILLNKNLILAINPENKYYKGTINFFKKIDETFTDGRRVNPQMEQSIYLDSCLTNSHVHDKYSSRLNFKETLEMYISGNVKILANSASSVPALQTPDYNNEDSLDVSYFDPSTLQDVDPSALQDIYTGNADLMDGKPRRIADEWLSVNRDVNKLKQAINDLQNDIEQETDIFKRDRSWRSITRRSKKYLAHVSKAIDVVYEYDPTINEKMSESVYVIANYLYNFYRIETKADTRKIIKDVIIKIEDKELKKRLMKLYKSDHK